MYDNYVSLGSNCEPAFQFRRLWGHDVSGFFNWMVTPLPALIGVIDADFQGLFERDKLEPVHEHTMVRDTRFGVIFHSPFHGRIGTTFDGPDFDRLHDVFLAKLAYLAAKFRANALSGAETLYVLKTDLPDARAQAARLRDLLLARYPGHRFDLLVLQSVDRIEAQWNEARIFNRYLRRFAPVDDARDGHLESWDRAFAEFPATPPQPGGSSREDVAALEQEARDLIAASRFAEAETTLRRAIAIGEERATTYHQLGIALAGQDRHTEAEAAQRSAIAISPNNAGFHYRLALALGAQARHAEKLAALRRAIAINPKNSTILKRFAEALRDAGQDSDAEDVSIAARRLAMREAAARAQPPA